MFENGRTRAALMGFACLALICGLVAAGCGGSSGGDTGGSSGESSGESETSGGGSGGESLTVGYVAFSLSTTPQQELKKGQEEQAAKYGYTLKTVDGGGEPAKAIAAMQTLITQGVDAIVVDSYGEEQLTAGILAAQSAEIPVYIAYAPGPAENVAWAVRGNAGTDETKKLVEDIGESGSVLALTLPAGPNCVSSQEQFEEVIAEYPGIKVRQQPVKIPGYQQEAATATTGWLKSQSSGENLAIWGCWDGPAVAAASAVNEAGMAGKVDLYGQNTEAATVELLKKNQFTASWYFDSVAFGRKMIELIHGDAEKSYGELEPEFTTFPGIEVNQENVNEFVKEFPQVLG